MDSDPGSQMDERDILTFHRGNLMAAESPAPSGSSSGNTAQFEMTLRHCRTLREELRQLENNNVVEASERSTGTFSEAGAEIEGFTAADIRSLPPRATTAATNVTPELDAEEVILSVFWRNAKLGAAFYTVETSEVSVLYDIVDVNPEFLITRTLFHQVNPSQVVTSGRLTEKFVHTLRSLTGPSEGGDLGGNCRLHILPGKDFQLESCRARVLSMRLPGEPSLTSGGTDEDQEKARVTFINSVVDLRAESAVLALGGLLRFLDKSWCDVNLEATDREVPVIAIKHVSLDDLVFMDPDSFLALQVFNPVDRANDFQRCAARTGREGLSVFSLFSRCRSNLGTKFLRVMLLHPTKDERVLNDRLDVIEFCLKQKNSDTVKRILDYMRHVKSVTRILTKLHGTQASIREWKTLFKTIYYAVLIGEICAAQRDEIALFRKIADCLTEELYHVGQAINTFIDFDEAELLNKFVVRPGVDPELDAMKQKFAGLSDLLSEVAQHELTALPAEIPQCSVIYIPEVGYLLAVPFWKDDIQDQDLQLPNTEFLFSASKVAHYKSARCRELDQILGDSLVRISEHETLIMLKLVSYVEARVEPVSRIVELLAQFDCLAAMALVSKDQGYVRPVLCGEQRVLEVVQGRHPLQELCVPEFVANDTSCSGPQLTVLTGPNSSGKSVYLKQVALIAFLAHVGSFVPARSAKIGILNQIFTRVQTLESVSTRLSAFMIDLRQMSLALWCSSPRSLIVVDEFGKGTAELDGLALLASSLGHFLDREELCPFVFVSTHFHRVLRLLPPSPLLQLQTMEHMRDNQGQIVYLHRLIEGSVNSSFAHQVAENCGLDPELVSRSRQVLEAMQKGARVEQRSALQVVDSLEQQKKICAEILQLDLQSNSVDALKNLLRKLQKQ